MPDAWTLTLEPDRYGREQVRTVNLTIDIREYKDKAIFPYLLMAANPALSMRDIQEVLLGVDERLKRPLGWLSRRRWLIHGKGSKGKPGGQINPQQATAAQKIMDDNPTASTRRLAFMFRAAGLPFSREYARKYRA
jgi:hypothetical protein